MAETERISNAGYVRRIEGLGHRTDLIDCPWCQRQTETRIEQTPSERTKCVFLLEKSRRLAHDSFSESGQFSAVSRAHLSSAV
jgi:DNA-binding helix-hairpin-helix protein with protein kinase domain